jgi:hypothetical protein
VRKLICSFPCDKEPQEGRDGKIKELDISILGTRPATACFDPNRSDFAASIRLVVGFSQTSLEAARRRRFTDTTQAMDVIAISKRSPPELLSGPCSLVLQ